MVYNRSFVLLLFLTTLAGSGYALATFGMRYTSDSFAFVAVAIILFGLAGTAYAEMSSLRHVSQPMIYLGVILGETALVLGYTAWVQDGFTLLEAGMSGIIVMGSSFIGYHG